MKKKTKEIDTCITYIIKVEAINGYQFFEFDDEVNLLTFIMEIQDDVCAMGLAYNETTHHCMVGDSAWYISEEG